MAGDAVDESPEDPDDDSSWEKVAKAHQLPPPHYDGPPPMQHPKEKAPCRTDYEAEGDSPLTLVVTEAASKAKTSRGWNDKNMNQILTSGKLTITNGTDEDIAIKEVYTEWRNADTNGEWVKCARDPTNTRTQQATYARRASAEHFSHIHGLHFHSRVIALPFHDRSGSTFPGTAACS